MRRRAAPLISPAAGTGLVPGLYHWGITYKTALGRNDDRPGAAVPDGRQRADAHADVRARPSVYDASPAYYTPNASIDYRIAVLYAGGGYSFGPATGYRNVGTKTPEIYLGVADRRSRSPALNIRTAF